MYILGISCFYHEAAAALLLDGKIVAAAAEERFTRKKHDPSFPMHAINFCLEQANISTKEIDYVVFYEKPFQKFERNLQMCLRYFPFSLTLFLDSMRNFLSEKLWIKSNILSSIPISPDNVLFVPHHISHVASGYFASPFSQAAFLSLDGVGEWTTGLWGTVKAGKIQPQKELTFPNSVGLLYSAFTSFLGFEVNDGEYKVMGMAGYGKPIYIKKMKKLYAQSADSSIQLNLKYFSFHLSARRMYSDLFIKEFQDLDRFDLAASLQACTEEIILRMANNLYLKTKEPNLIFSGGVALNTAVNGKLLNKTPFKDIFIYPAAGDDGGSVGAALYAYSLLSGHNKTEGISSIFLGKSFTQNEVETYLKVNKIPHKKYTRSSVSSLIAKELANNKVIALFEGRAEFGPRALGHRSILANPHLSEMKDIVNKKIKFREEFRPFAPAILEEKSKDYFFDVNANLARFMLGTFKVKQLARKKAPAIVHVDGTSRVQIVPKDFQGSLRSILEAFYTLTGIPLLLNTSFNLKGEPIVNSPEDAYKTFMNSGIDMVVIENCVIKK